MADIIPFRARVEAEDEECPIDLFTAVDLAIRDLRDIRERWGQAEALRQADECLEMLERALSSAT